MAPPPMSIRARCYPFCVAVMKALEAFGVWTFMLIGSTQFTFPNAHTRSFVLEEGSPGHAWLVAPPFKILDPTARFQHWQDGEERLLPKWVASKRFKRASKEKLFEPALLPSDEQGPYMDPRMPRFWKTFPPGELKLEQVAVYYQPHRVAIPDVPLSQSGVRIGSRPAQEFVDDLVRRINAAQGSSEAVAKESESEP